MFLGQFFFNLDIFLDQKNLDQISFGPKQIWAVIFSEPKNLVRFFFDFVQHITKHLQPISGHLGFGHLGFSHLGFALGWVAMAACRGCAGLLGCGL